MSQLIGQNRKGNALLCRVWGETDIPVVLIAKTNPQLRGFIANEWTGEACGETDLILSQIDEHDFSADDASVCNFELEIGGASFEDVAS